MIDEFKIGARRVDYILFVRYSQMMVEVCLRTRLEQFQNSLESGMCWHVLACVGMCGHMWACVGMCGHVWACEGMCGHVWAYVGMCEHVWACVGMCGHVWACVGMWPPPLTARDDVTYLQWLFSLEIGNLNSVFSRVIIPTIEWTICI